MQFGRLRRLSGVDRSGAALILMILLIVVIGACIWLGIDPLAAFFKSSSAGMPWEDEYRLIRSGEEVPPPNEKQPQILDNIMYKGEILTRMDDAMVVLYISPDGRINGSWSGTHRPKKEIMWEVVGAGFEGNIAPSKIYIDEKGVEDPTKLFFIGKGQFLILETNSDTNIIRRTSGVIYVTGWLDYDYNMVGKLIVTSDKKTYWEYDWECAAEDAIIIPDFGSFSE